MYFCMYEYFNVSNDESKICRLVRREREFYLHSKLILPLVDVLCSKYLPHASLERYSILFYPRHLDYRGKHNLYFILIAFVSISDLIKDLILKKRKYLIYSKYRFVFLNFFSTLSH